MDPVADLLRGTSPTTEEKPTPTTSRRAAYSPLTARLVHGSVETGIVLAVYPKGLYLGLPGAASVLPVVSADAIALPTAMRIGLRSDEITWPVEAGATALVGDGAVELPGLRIAAVRQWRPAQVRRADPMTVGQPRRVLRKRWRNLDRALADEITAAVRSPARVRDLIGRGYGLTPACDDALAGALLVAYGLDLEPTLASAVRPLIHRTTSLSASFLIAAIEGYAVPPVAAFVSAAVAGDAKAAEQLLPPVLAIGHSSGRDLVAGVLGALRALTPTATAKGHTP